MILTARIFEPWCDECGIFYHPSTIEVKDHVYRVESKTYRLICCVQGHVLGRKFVRRVNYAI